MAPFVYQVSITVDEEYVKDYRIWLRAHVVDMLALDCFTGGELWESRDQGQFCVHYYYRSPEDFEKYLGKYAPKMRGSLPDKFSGNVFFERKNLKNIKL